MIMDIYKIENSMETQFIWYRIHKCRLKRKYDFLIAQERYHHL
jgi:hypothetical protein